MRKTKTPIDIGAAVAAEVRAELARQGMTQQGLAQLIGMSQAAVSRRLTGATPFDVRELSLVASVLHVGVVQFVCPPGRVA